MKNAGFSLKCIIANALSFGSTIFNALARGKAVLKKITTPSGAINHVRNPPPLILQPISQNLFLYKKLSYHLRMPPCVAKLERDRKEDQHVFNMPTKYFLYDRNVQIFWNFLSNKYLILLRNCEKNIMSLTRPRTRIMMLHIFVTS